TSCGSHQTSASARSHHTDTNSETTMAKSSPTAKDQDCHGAQPSVPLASAMCGVLTTSMATRHSPGSRANHAALPCCRAMVPVSVDMASASTGVVQPATTARMTWPPGPAGAGGADFEEN